MSARALVSGRLWRDPERRASGAGKSFGSAFIRVGSGDDKKWWKLLVFIETVIEEMLSLKDGDALAATGEFKAEVFDGRNGPRISFTLFADRVISPKRKKRERDKDRRSEPRPAPINSTDAQRPIDRDLNDEVPR
jgi:hypothetical protein